MRMKILWLTFLVGLALTLALGVNIAIFIPVNAVLLRPLPYQDPSRLTLIQERSEQFGELRATYPNFMYWRDQNKVFTQLAAYSKQSFTLTGVEEPERVQGGRISPSLFSVLGVSPLLGRGFLAEEEQPTGARVVVIGQNLWRRRFGSDPNIIGKTLTIDGGAYTAVGIMPGDFSFPPQTELWVPLVNDNNLMVRRQHFLSVVGRLKPGVSIDQAQVEMEAIATRAPQQYRYTDTNYGVALHPLKKEAEGGLRPALLTLFGAAAIMLLMTCVNAANLLLARAFMQSQEAVGSETKAPVYRSLFTRLSIEVLLIYVVSVAAGLALAYFGVRRFSTDSQSLLANSYVDSWVGGFDLRPFGFALMMGFVALALSSLTPLIQAVILDRNARPSATYASPGVTASPGKNPLRWLHLILGAPTAVVEVALALILMTGAGLLFKSYIRLQSTESGFRPDHTLTARLALPRYKYQESVQVAEFYQELIQRLQAIPGVLVAGAVDSLPLSGASNQASITIESQEPRNSIEPLLIDLQVATPDYFRAIGAPLISGRLFTDQDSATAPQVVIVDAAFVRRFFPSADAIGRRLRLGAGTDAPWNTIVGVVGDVKIGRLEEDSRGQIYSAAWQQPRANLTLVAHTAVDPMILASALRNEVRRLDKDLPVFQVRTMEQVLKESLASQRLSLLLLAMFALLALAEATIGVYSFAACLMIGGVRRIVTWRTLAGTALVFAGVGIGLLGALAMTRRLSGLLFQISATDPVVFSVSLLAVTGAALIAFSVAILAHHLQAKDTMRAQTALNH